MRFSRTRLTDVLHRVDSAFSPPGPEGPGRDDGSVEDDQAQVVWGEEHLFDAPSPGVALAENAPEAISDADSIGRRGRAVAVTLIAATQRPTQKAMGQGALRSQM